MKDNSSRNKKKSKWTKVLKEDFEELLKSKSYEIKEDGTIKIEGWHINLGTIVEIDENYFVIHLPPPVRYIALGRIRRPPWRIFHQS